jgi:hypothetical protein
MKNVSDIIECIMIQVALGALVLSNYGPPCIRLPPSGTLDFYSGAYSLTEKYLWQDERDRIVPSTEEKYLKFPGYRNLANVHSNCRSQNHA